MSRTKDRHTLNEAFNFSFRINALGGGSGVFRQLYTWNSTAQVDIPWLTEATAKRLDIMYHGGRSGRKWCSPMLEDFMKAYDDDTLPYNPVEQAIIPMLWDIFGANWTARWNVLSAEYEPLENYSMSEVMENDDTTVTHGKTTTRTGSVEMTPEAVMTVESSVYAYDSSSPSPDAKTVSTPEGSNTTEYNDLADAESGKTETEHGYELTRTGNIGTVTAQDMLLQELEVRKYNFYTSVFEDIDSVFTIPVY